LVKDRLDILAVILDILKKIERKFMELVYLWVEDYKNIKKQGFNFSPWFHCEYNNDYIPDFFGKKGGKEC